MDTVRLPKPNDRDGMAGTNSCAAVARWIEARGPAHRPALDRLTGPGGFASAALSTRQLSPSPAPASGYSLVRAADSQDWFIDGPAACSDDVGESPAISTEFCGLDVPSPRLAKRSRYFGCQQSQDFELRTSGGASGRAKSRLASAPCL